MNIPTTLESLATRIRRHPFLALGALFAAIACVAVLAAGASALTGGDHGPDLGSDVRVGQTTQTQHDDPSDNGDHDGDDHDGDDPVGERDAEDHDDVTTPVTPGSLPADGDHENEDDSDHDGDHDSGRDSDHDSDHDRDDGNRD